MIKKLAAYRRQNQLDLTLQELGRIARTEGADNLGEGVTLLAPSRAGLPTVAPRHSGPGPRG
jgi:hypothetical protein